MKKNIDTKKTAIIISICLGIAILIIVLTLTFIIRNHKPKEEIQNNIDSEENIEEEEEDIIRIIIDNEQQDEEDDNTEDENSNKQDQNQNTTTEIPNTTGTTPYYIKVNNLMNTVTIYQKDSNGTYTIPIKVMICSTGDYTPPCPKYPETVYKIPNTANTKFIWGKMQGNVYAQYATRITGNILFHSVPYTDGWKTSAKGTLEWWEYDKLGTSASLGCIRLTVEDAKWIYDNIVAGTTVEFYSDSNPGPLGKPTSKIISGYPDEIKGWDPTDPDLNNPWRTYVEPINTENIQSEEDPNQSNNTNEEETEIINSQIEENQEDENINIEEDIL